MLVHWRKQSQCVVQVYSVFNKIWFMILIVVMTDDHCMQDHGSLPIHLDRSLISLAEGVAMWAAELRETCPGLYVSSTNVRFDKSATFSDSKPLHLDLIENLKTTFCDTVITTVAEWLILYAKTASAWSHSQSCFQVLRHYLCWKTIHTTTRTSKKADWQIHNNYVVNSLFFYKWQQKNC